MSTMLANFLHRARKCRVACSLKLILAVSFYFAIHIALSHQSDVSPYPFILLVAFVAVVAVLALTSHLNCQFSNGDKNGDVD